jgi:hypothetical protein
MWFVGSRRVRVLVVMLARRGGARSTRTNHG